MTPEKTWRAKVRIVCAKNDGCKMYYLIDENYEFISIIKGFLDMIQARDKDNVSPNTIRSYCNLLWHFVVFLKIHGLDFLDLDGKPEFLVKFRAWLKNPYRFYGNVDIISDEYEFEYQDNKLDANTINQIIGRVSSLYLWLKATNRIGENPVIYINVVASKSLNEKNPLSHTRRGNKVRKNSLKSALIRRWPKTVCRNDFEKFLTSVKLIRDKLLLLCLICGGFRIGELLGVKIEDIDFAEQSIAVVFRPDNINNSRAKAGVGRDRVVHMPPEIMTLIDKYLSSEWLNSNSQSDFLFVNVKSKIHGNNGKPLDKSSVDSMFRFYSMKVFGCTEKYGKRRPAKKIHPHQLRHTHATELVREYVDAGEPVDWKFISYRLGHSSVTTTQDFYIHLEKGDYKKEYSKLLKYRTGKLIGGTYDSN